MKKAARTTAFLFAELQHPGMQPARLFFDYSCDTRRKMLLHQVSMIRRVQIFLKRFDLLCTHSCARGCSKLSCSPAGDKLESFAHLFYDDVNDPAYDELRKELDKTFRNARLQDITDLPDSYSLVSLPFGGEGAGGSADRSAPIEAYEGRDVLMPVYDQGGTMNTCWSFVGTGTIESYLIRNHYDKFREKGIELSKWQVPAGSSLFVSKDTVIGGYGADPSQYGEGIGNDLAGGGSPTTYGQAVTGWAGLDYEENDPKPRNIVDVAGLTPAQVDQAVARGRDALFLLSPTPNMIGHEGYGKNIDHAEAVVYDSGAVDAINNCLMKIGPVYAEVCHMPNEPAEKGGVNEYENWEYGSMYYPLWTDETVAGHAVTIVGWDDHYSRDLFGENTPPEDGAFLIKNSIGKKDDTICVGKPDITPNGSGGCTAVSIRSNLLHLR